MIRIMEAAVAYFAMLFGIVSLGQLAHLELRHIGVAPLYAQAAPIAVGALLLLLAAGFVVRSFDIPPALPHRISIGLGAVALLALAAALGLTLPTGRWSKGLGLELHLSPLVAAGFLGFAALLPLVRERRR